MNEPAQDGPAGGAWAKLRQRKVVQWGVGYLTGAWGLLQALEFLSETYGWPPQLRMLAVPALLAGLPIVLVLAWYHGDRGHQRATRTEVVLLAALLAVGAGGVWRYYGTIQQAGTVAAAATPAGSEAAIADSRPSIAVLPFENRSTDAEDAFFVDGIQDDIVTQLTQVRGLRVIASTSTERLRDTRLSAREIAKQLGVSKLLQGRVQRVGDRVRINVILVDAATESQDWAERYDRGLNASNVLAIQSEIAATVAARLKTGIPATAEADAGHGRARNLEAWEAYQRGRNSRDAVEAEQNFRRAIEADPGFAPAYVGLSQALRRQVYSSGARRDVNLPDAEAAVETALQLDPTLADAWLVSADFAFDRSGPAEAESRLRKAIELNPNYAQAYETLADMQLELGRPNEALLNAQKGLALDPLSPGLRESLGNAFEASGRYDEAEVQYRRAVELDPSGAFSWQALASFLAYVRGRFDLAVPMQQKAVQLAPDNAFLRGQLGMLYLDLGDEARATDILDEATSRWPDRTNVNTIAAFLAMYRGDQLASVRYAQKVLETQPKHLGAIYVIVRADLARGDLAAARSLFAFAYPQFLAPVPPEIDRDSVGPAVMAAWLLTASGDKARARVLLDRIERFVDTRPVLGEGGRDLARARVKAMRGDNAAAAREVRATVKAGWRGPLWRAALDFDPLFLPLHNDPEYRAAVDEINLDLATQRTSLAAAPAPPARTH